jgi:hypothetical protein
MTLLRIITASISISASAAAAPNLEGGVQESDRQSRADYEKNWQEMLGGLKQVVEESS